LKNHPDRYAHDMLSESDIRVLFLNTLNCSILDLPNIVQSLSYSNVILKFVACRLYMFEMRDKLFNLGRDMLSFCLFRSQVQLSNLGRDMLS
jgi:hypothetical protein